MKRYRAQRIITLQPGHAARVQLTPAQAFDRRHAVRVVDDQAGVYEVTAAFQFLAGEEFGYDGELPHVLASQVVPVSAETSVDLDDRLAAGLNAEAVNAELTGSGLVGTLLGRKGKAGKTSKS